MQPNEKLEKGPMIAVLERETPSAASHFDRRVWVRLGSGSSCIRAKCWQQASAVRRQLHHRGWICTSPSPSWDREEYTFFVTKGPATVRRDLRGELGSLAGTEIVFENE
jgi:hypothetical protein